MPNANCSANTPITHQYALSAYNTTTASALTMRFTSNNFGLKRTVRTVKDEGTGSPWDVVGSEIESQYQVSGPISMVPRPDQMPTLLPILLGNAQISAGPPQVYKPAGKICEFFQLGHLDPTPGINQYFRYGDAVVNTWSMKASTSNQILSLDMQVEACTRTTPAVGTWPTLSLSVVQPWVFRQLVLTIASNTYRVRDFEVTGNNNLSAGDFYNSISRTEMPTQKQDYMLRTTIPFDLANDLALLNTSVNATATAIFTAASGSVLKFDFPSLFTRPEDPSVSGRQRVHLPIEWHAQYNPSVANETPIKIEYTP